MMRRLVLPFVALMLLASPALADGPTKQTITFTETNHDERLTEACGVPVDTIINGRITFFTFDGQGPGPVQIVSKSARLVSTTAFGSIRYSDAGINLTNVAPDGTATLSIIGTLPVRVSGILVINLETGETVLDVQHSDIERVCSLLT